VHGALSGAEFCQSVIVFGELLIPSVRPRSRSVSWGIDELSASMPPRRYLSEAVREIRSAGLLSGSYSESDSHFSARHVPPRPLIVRDP
jgi:hypothetical protein